MRQQSHWSEQALDVKTSAPMDDTAKSILFLIAGWLLGTLSPVIAESIRRSRDATTTHKAIRAELDEIRILATLAAYYIQMRFGTIDRAYLDWVRSVLRSYTGRTVVSKMLVSVEAQLATTDEAIAAMAAIQRAGPGGAIGVRKVIAPILDTRLPIIWQLDNLLQRQLMDVRRNLDLMNEDVDEAKYYLRLTFSQMDETLRGSVNASLDAAYRRVSDRAKMVVDRIDAVSRL